MIADLSSALAIVSDNFLLINFYFENQQISYHYK